VFYVDPPYVLSSRADSRERYQHEMNDTQHIALAVALNNIQGMAVLSGYPSSLYDELYADWTRLEYSSTTNGNSVSTEVLWLSPNITRPETLPLFAHAATS
jgi:DNA adenine methylase